MATNPQPGSLIFGRTAGEQNIPVLVDDDGMLVTSGGGGGGGPVTIANGADTAEGSTTDAKVVGDNAGTVSAKLRGLNYLLAKVTDTVNNWLNVNIQNTSLAVTTPLVAGALVGQTKIASSGTAVQLGSNALSNGVILSALSTNTAKITVGGSGVTNTVNGSGNGYILEAGASVSFAVSNTNVLYINGTTGDIVSFAGS